MIMKNAHDLLSRKHNTKLYMRSNSFKNYNIQKNKVKSIIYTYMSEIYIICRPEIYQATGA